MDSPTILMRSDQLISSARYFLVWVLIRQRIIRRKLQPHYCELFELVDARFKHWAFISNSLRMDITIFRENRAEDLRNNGVVIEGSWMDQFAKICAAS